MHGVTAHVSIVVEDVDLTIHPLSPPIGQVTVRKEEFGVTNEEIFIHGMRFDASQVLLIPPTCLMLLVYDQIVAS